MTKNKQWFGFGLEQAMVWLWTGASNLKSTILREARQRVLAFYPPYTKRPADKNGFESYCASDEAIQAFQEALEMGPCREDIEETIRIDEQDQGLPPGLKLALVQHVFALGALPKDVLRECAFALEMNCDSGDPRREHVSELLASIASLLLPKPGHKDT